MWELAAAMAAASLLKSMHEQKRANKQRAIVAETQRMSPWTGQWADQSSIQEPNTIGNALSWGTTGAALGQGMANTEAQQGMMDAYMANMKANTAKINADLGISNAPSSTSLLKPNTSLQMPMGGSTPGGAGNNLSWITQSPPGTPGMIYDPLNKTWVRPNGSWTMYGGR